MSSLHSVEAISPLDTDYDKVQASITKSSLLDSPDLVNPVTRPGAFVEAALQGGSPAQNLNIPEIPMNIPDADPNKVLHSDTATIPPSKVSQASPPNTKKYLMPNDPAQPDNEPKMVEIDPREMPYMLRTVIAEREAIAVELSAKKARIAFYEDNIANMAVKITELETELASFKVSQDNPAVAVAQDNQEGSEIE